MSLLSHLPTAWRGSLPARFATALPDFALGLGFLITWAVPYTFGQKAVTYFVLVMLLEFLIVHSAGFMGSVVFTRPLSTRIKVKSLLGLGAFYAIFAAGFALGFRAWWPLWAIFALTLNRILIVLTGDIPAGKERAYIHRGWAVSTLFYLLFAFLTVFLPMPALGITGEVIRAQAFTASGLWIDEPQRVLAFGFFYFTSLGFSELFSHRWLPDGHLPQHRTLSETPS